MTPEELAAAFPHAPPEQLARFLTKILVDESGCWLWMAAKAYGGYGSFTIRRKSHAAHRVAYLWKHSACASDLTVDHLCRVRHCVNPNHMELVPIRINTLRGTAPTAINARKTHCVAGHPLSGSNLWITPIGGRYCRTCARKRHKEWRDKRPRKVRVQGIKLTLDAIAQIRARRAAGESQTSIAADLGVHQSMISRICSGGRWANAS